MPDGLLPEGFFLGAEDYLCVAQPSKNGNCLGVVELCRCGEDKGIVAYHFFCNKFLDMVALWMHVCRAILPIEEFYFLGSFLTCTLKKPFCHYCLARYLKPITIDMVAIGKDGFHHCRLMH